MNKFYESPEVEIDKFTIECSASTSYKNDTLEGNGEDIELDDEY